MYFDVPGGENRGRNLRRLAVGTLGLFFGFLRILGISGAFVPKEESPAPAAPTPPSTAEQANIIEQKLTLESGITVTCILFPSPTYGGSCDWSAAHRKGNS